MILLLWVIMSFPVFSNVQTWDEFNSSLLIEVTRSKGVFTCSGVAISREVIITAGHCLDGDVKKVRIFTQSFYDPKAPSLEIKKFKIHPDYHPKDSRYQSDLAKIYMKDLLPESIRILPIYPAKMIIGNLYRFGFGARNKKNVRTVITPTFRKVNQAEKVVELNDDYSYSGDSGGPIFLQAKAMNYILAIHSTLSFGPEGRFSYNPLLAHYQNWIFEN